MLDGGHHSNRNVLRRSAAPLLAATYPRCCSTLSHDLDLPTQTLTATFTNV